jgi:hypothetical protein
MELGEQHFPGVGPERGAARPAQTVLLTTNHETVEVKVAPIECDLEQLMQLGDAAVALHVQTPPNGRVNLEEQDVELVNFAGSVWLDHSSSRSLGGRRSQPPVFPGLGFRPCQLEKVRVLLAPAPSESGRIHCEKQRTN